MKNIEMSIDKNILTIEIDLTENFGLSKSGKSVVIASTGGNIDIGKNGIRLGVNCYKKAE